MVVQWWYSGGIVVVLWGQTDLESLAQAEIADFVRDRRVGVDFEQNVRCLQVTVCRRNASVYEREGEGKGRAGKKVRGTRKGMKEGRKGKTEGSEGGELCTHACVLLVLCVPAVCESVRVRMHAMHAVLTDDTVPVQVLHPTRDLDQGRPHLPGWHLAPPRREHWDSLAGAGPGPSSPGVQGPVTKLRDDAAPRQPVFNT